MTSQIVIIFVLVILLLIWVLVKYRSTQQMIRISDEAIYPTQETEIVTDKGKVEKLSFHLKSWKTKRWMTIGTSLFMIIFLSLTIIFNETMTWSSSLIFIYLPLMTINLFVVPSFLILSKGIYVDEHYYDWKYIKGFSVSRIGIGHHAYGMFDHAANHKDIKLFFDKTLKHHRSIYIRNDADVEEVRQLLAKYEVSELENDANRIQVK
ncbi:hypothetical protein ACM26V_05425 [Salipaludibacillus sp. HK11]|uniref:hypothetical protein n=1 Tax=Salipaludibacillus sp. HK11 TaxID=3394320 RepID=UPI0039FC7E97